jgi:hypothetical protein
MNDILLVILLLSFYFYPVLILAMFKIIMTKLENKEYSKVFNLNQSEATCFATIFFHELRLCATTSIIFPILAIAIRPHVTFTTFRI